MKSRWNKTVMAMAFGALLAFAPAATGNDKIAQAAKDAKTSSEHAEVAKQYRDHAMSLEKKAAKLEREARVQDAGPTRALEQKWPAMVVNARERKAQLAVQARRAAQESYVAAERHEKLAGQGAERSASTRD